MFVNGGLLWGVKWVAICCVAAHFVSLRTTDRRRIRMNESILDATIDQLRMAQAKITYLGTQSKPIPTVIFFTEGHHVDRDQFASVQQHGKAYPNDDLPYTMQFTVRPEELRRILDALKPVLAGNDKVSGPVILSFTVTRSERTVIGHEF